jgi:hypothetical protein
MHVCIIYFRRISKLWTLRQLQKIIRLLFTVLRVDALVTRCTGLVAKMTQTNWALTYARKRYWPDLAFAAASC